MLSMYIRTLVIGTSSVDVVAKWRLLGLGVMARPTPGYLLRHIMGMQ